MDMRTSVSTRSSATEEDAVVPSFFLDSLVTFDVLSDFNSLRAFVLHGDEDVVLGL